MRVLKQLTTACLTLAFSSTAVLAAECLRQGDMIFYQQHIYKETGSFIPSPGKDPNIAWYEFTAARGDPLGNCIVAAFHFVGDIYPQDISKAAQFFRGPNVKHCFAIFPYAAAMLETGIGMKKNKAEAAYWFRAYLATLHHVPGGDDRADLVAEIRKATAANVGQALFQADQWWRGQFTGTPESLYDRAQFFLKSEPERAGFPIASSLLRIAANQGHEAAALELGRLYVECRNARNSGYIPKYMEPIAEAGNAEAMAYLGLYLSWENRNRKFRARQAQKWLAQAARSDLPEDLHTIIDEEERRIVNRLAE